MNTEGGPVGLAAAAIIIAIIAIIVVFGRYL